MNISAEALRKHLHGAAIDDLETSLQRDGYTVEREPRIQVGPQQYIGDLRASRGSETVVYEVKVLDTPVRPRLADVVAAVRGSGAEFKLVLVRPQRSARIVLDDAAALVRDALASVGHDSSKPPGEVSGVEDVDFDDVHVGTDVTAASGSAVVTLRPASQAPGGNQPGFALPATFTIWFRNADRSLARPPVVRWDTSDYGGPDA